jgi:hypothetical protein
MKDGGIYYTPDAHRFLKPALVRDHGYMYIDAVAKLSGTRTWRCAVKDCANTIVEEA